MEPKYKILLSGGWGYSNLGDDAILLSSILMIRAIFNDAEISVMSFNRDHTEQTLQDDSIRVVASVHRLGFGTFPYYELNAYKKSPLLYYNYGIGRKANNWFISVERKILLARFRKFTSSELDEEFSRADLFIMSGGGYFNSWRTMFYSKIWELKIATRYKKKTILIGQTLGPFEEDQFELVKNALKDVDVVSVRDPNSVSDLAKIGQQAFLSPDLALFEIENLKLGEYAGIIPGGMLNEEIDNLVESFRDERLCRFPIKLIVTRLYRDDVIIVHKIQHQLAAIGIRAEVCIHSSYVEMLNDISSCRFMVSRNLHGLVLAYRSGIPVLCVNNDRKFIGFMEQIHRSEFLVNLSKTAPGVLAQMLDEVMADKRLSVKEELGKQVYNNFIMCLTNCGLQL